MLGLINGAPYLICILSCLYVLDSSHVTMPSPLTGRQHHPQAISLTLRRLTEPLNSLLGRRGTILLTCFFSFTSCLGQAFVRTSGQLLACRVILGLGIGPKTATIPIYVSECVPEGIRGGLVSQWQLWDAFGILAGLITSNIFRDKVSGSDRKERLSILTVFQGATWRLMLGSPVSIIHAIRGTSI